METMKYEGYDRRCFMQAMTFWIHQLYPEQDEQLDKIIALSQALLGGQLPLQWAQEIAENFPHASAGLEDRSDRLELILKNEEGVITFHVLAFLDDTTVVIGEELHEAFLKNHHNELWKRKHKMVMIEKDGFEDFFRALTYWCHRALEGKAFVKEWLEELENHEERESALAINKWFYKIFSYIDADEAHMIMGYIKGGIAFKSDDEIFAVYFNESKISETVGEISTSSDFYPIAKEHSWKIIF